MNPVVEVNTTVASVVTPPASTPAAPFNMDQINQINTFFSSTYGVVTFSLVWLFCVLGLLCFTGYMLAKNEEDERINPELARQRERQGMMLLGQNPDAPVEIELPTICTNEEEGNYQRIL